MLSAPGSLPSQQNKWHYDLLKVKETKIFGKRPAFYRYNLVGNRDQKKASHFSAER